MKKLKTVFLSFFLCFLFLFSFSSPFSVFAAGNSTVSDFFTNYYTFFDDVQKKIFTSTKYLVNKEFDFLSGLYFGFEDNDLLPASTKISYPEINRSVESSLLSLYPDVDLVSNPYYIVYGKSKVVWSNLDTSDSGRYDVCYCLASIVSNAQPLGGSYSRYTVSDSPFKSVDGNFYIGYLYFVRYQFDKNDNYLGFDSAYVKPSKMPYILYNTGASSPLEVDIYFSSNSAVTSYDNSGNYHNYLDYEISNPFRFKINTVNSTSFNLYNSSYPDILSFIRISHNFYITQFMSNNADAISLFRYWLNVPESAEPFFTQVGIPAGTVINGDNIIDYSNHGFYIDNDQIYYNTTNNYDYGLPDLKIQYDNLFNNQPFPALSFDSDIRYNYVDLFNAVLSSGSSSGIPDSWLFDYPPWQPDEYIVVTTVPPFPVLPSINTDVAEVAKTYMGVSYELYHSFGDLFAVALFGLLLGFSVWIFKR